MIAFGLAATDNDETGESRDSPYRQSMALELTAASLLAGAAALLGRIGFEADLDTALDTLATGP